MRVESVQPTPNPNAFKFLTDRHLVTEGTRSLESVADAGDDALAKDLFGVAGVTGLFFCENFVTVSMTPDADWRAVHQAVVEILGRHKGYEPPAATPAPQPVGATAGAGAATAGEGGLLGEINALLDDRVRPALAGDGGGLEVLGLEGKQLKIRYQGACGSCPSSMAGTLHAIQNLLQTEVDSELEVVPA